MKYRLLSLKPVRHDVRVRMSNANVGAGTYEDGATSPEEHLNNPATQDSNKPWVLIISFISHDCHASVLYTELLSLTMNHRTKPLSGSNYLQPIGAVLLLCTLAAGFFVLFKGQPSAVVSMLAKSGFTAAFALIFVSEIGDKVYNSFKWFLSLILNFQVHCNMSVHLLDSNIRHIPPFPKTSL